MKPRIGIDCDGTLIDNNVNWANYYNSNHRAHNHPFFVQYDPPDWDYYTRCCQRCFDHCVHDPSMFEAASLIPGAPEALRELRLFTDLWLISHRSPELTLSGIRVLKKHKVYDLFATFDWSFTPKRDTCERYGISALIDDAPKNIEALRNTKTVPIIFGEYDYNANLLGPRARNWNEVVFLVRKLI